MTQAALPTYRTVADVLEKKNGSGMKLLGWTALRTIMIGPPMMLVGVPAKQAFFGATVASGLISLFTLLRIFDATKTGLGANSHRRALGSGRRPTRRPTRK